MEETSQNRHELIVDFLATLERYSDGRKWKSCFPKVKSPYNSWNVHNIAEAEINNAVVVFTDVLNIGSGSGGNFNLYELLQAYLQVPEKRIAMNRVVQEAIEIKLKKFVAENP